MTDPSTLAATDSDDRDGLPDPPSGPIGGLPPEPPVVLIDLYPPADTPPPASEPHDESPPEAGSAAAEPGPEAESDPGAQAPPEPHPEPLRTLLETAAICRPVEEVTALVGLLKDSEGLADPGHEALRTAAVTRPLDEVRRMVALLGEHPEEEAEAEITLRAAAVGRPIEDVALLATILDPESPGAAPASSPYSSLGKPLPPPPEAAPKQEPAGAPAPAGSAAGILAALGGDRLGRVLRWPTAAFLLFCGALHLPGNLAQPPAPGLLLPLAVALMCLALGVLLAVRDVPAVWRAAAVAALAVVALHIVGGVSSFAPLDGTLGAPYPWAGVAAVLTAGGAAVLAGLALASRPPGPGADDA
ncbi:hypothetical protein [Streptomyces sp. NPDC002287]